MKVSRLNRSLDIFWDGRIVGRYDLLEDGSELFAYDVGYLDSSGATPISHSLPLRADPYGRRQLRPFFAGLLPEESQRQRIAAYLGLAESDDFSMLEAIGGECAGALEIIPHGKAPHENEDSLSPCDEKHRNSFNIASMSFDPEIIYNKIKEYKPEFVMEYEPDPLRQAIADSWPDRLDDSCARAEWDWKPEYDLDAMTRDMLEKLELKFAPKLELH